MNIWTVAAIAAFALLVLPKLSLGQMGGATTEVSGDDLSQGRRGNRRSRRDADVPGGVGQAAGGGGTPGTTGVGDPYPGPPAPDGRPTIIVPAKERGPTGTPVDSGPRLRPEPVRTAPGTTGGVSAAPRYQVPIATIGGIGYSPGGNGAGSGTPTTSQPGGSSGGGIGGTVFVPPSAPAPAVRDYRTPAVPAPKPKLAPIPGAPKPGRAPIPVYKRGDGIQ